MLAEERFQKIEQWVNEKGFVSTKEMAMRFKVTETTIRRDCEELEQHGLLIRVHGGAKSILKQTILSNRGELNMQERNGIYQMEKQQICKRAAAFVHDGDCVFLDGGTSVVELLPLLKQKKVKIVTHSQLIASAFDKGEAELFMLGGKYIPEYSMSVGPVTLQNLEKFNFDHAFLSCAGADIEKGEVYTAEMDTMAVKMAAMKQAVHKYLLCDTSKFKIKGFCSFIRIHDFDALICNHDETLDMDMLPDNVIVADEDLF